MTDDIVTRLRAVLHNDRSVELMNREAADEIERLRKELAACCRDGGPGAHTAGPVEHFIPEAL